MAELQIKPWTPLSYTSWYAQAMKPEQSQYYMKYRKYTHL